MWHLVAETLFHICTKKEKKRFLQKFPVTNWLLNHYPKTRVVHIICIVSFSSPGKRFDGTSFTSFSSFFFIFCRGRNYFFFCFSRALYIRFRVTRQSTPGVTTSDGAYLLPHTFVCLFFISHCIRAPNIHFMGTTDEIWHAENVVLSAKAPGCWNKRLETTVLVQSWRLFFQPTLQTAACVSNSLRRAMFIMWYSENVEQVTSKKTSCVTLLTFTEPVLVSKSSLCWRCTLTYYFPQNLRFLSGLEEKRDIVVFTMNFQNSVSFPRHRKLGCTTT